MLKRFMYLNFADLYLVNQSISTLADEEGNGGSFRTPAVGC